MAISLKVHALNTRAMANLSQQAFWQQMFTLHSNEFSQVLMIVERCLTMAVSSSCSERGFSCLSRLKAEFRNSLKVQTVDHLLNICLNGPSPEQFVAEKAIIHWLQDTQRARRQILGNRPAMYIFSFTLPYMYCLLLCIAIAHFNNV